MARETRLTVVAVGCVLWTLSLAIFKYASPSATFSLRSETDHILEKEVETDIVDSTLPDRQRCLNLLSSGLLGRFGGALSSPRQAAALWLSELVLRLRVPGQMLDYGSPTEVAAVLMNAVHVCYLNGRTRRVWTTFALDGKLFAVSSVELSLQHCTHSTCPGSMGREQVQGLSGCPSTIHVSACCSRIGQAGGQHCLVPRNGLGLQARTRAFAYSRRLRSRRPRWHYSGAAAAPTPARCSACAWVGRDFRLVASSWSPSIGSTRVPNVQPTLIGARLG